MGSNPITNYKTSQIGGSPPGPKTGKANEAGPSGTSETSSTPSAVGWVESHYKAGLKKQGKSQETDETKSGDPVADLQNALDQFNNQGVSQGDVEALKKFLGDFSTESLVAKFPDMVKDISDKITAIIDVLKKKKGDLIAGIESGTGSVQQVQLAQKYLSVIEEGLAKMAIELKKTDAVNAQNEKTYSFELTEFLKHGGSKDVREFDINGDGWLGGPEAEGSYRIGIRVHDEPFVSKEKEQLAKAGSTVQFKFKKGGSEYSAINPKTNLPVHFDAKTFAVMSEQVTAPGYVTNLGFGFKGDDKTNIDINDKGEVEVKTKAVSNSQYPAEVGAGANVTEFIWVQVDEADGSLVRDDQGNLKVAPFEMKDGELIQTTPKDGDQKKFKQVYVKEVRVSTDSPSGDTVIEYRGGDADEKIMGMRIAGPDSKTPASSVSFGIFSGSGDSLRKSPVILDAGGYNSTNRTGIKDPKHFASQYSYDPSGKATGPQADQINDTLKHFVAKPGSTEIDSLLNRGLLIEARGNITGTTGNDMFIIPPAQDGLTAKDAAFAGIYDGQGGHNAFFGKKVGTAYIAGATMADLATEGDGEIYVGINPYGETTTKKGTIVPVSGETGKSNKLFIKVNAPQAKVGIQSTVDGKLSAFTSAGTGNPAADAWDEGDDFYDVTGNQIFSNAMDANVPNQFFDSDLNPKDGHKPLKGKVGPAGASDFQVGGSIYKEKADKLNDSIRKKATEKEDEFKVDGNTKTWMKGKYYQEDKVKLDQFFADFSASKANALDPFKQTDDLMKQASGGDKE